MSGCANCKRVNNCGHSCSVMARSVRGPVPTSSQRCRTPLLGSLRFPLLVLREGQERLNFPLKLREDHLRFEERTEELELEPDTKTKGV